MTRPPPLAPGAAVAVTLGALVTFGLVRRFAIPGEWHLLANVAAAAGFGAIALLTGLRADELGLARARLGAGARLGGLALGLVTVVVGAALLFPAGRDAFVDARLDTSLAEMLRRVLVDIPLGTVLLEELAFRGVLLALLLRVTGRGPAIAASVAAFSVWHLPPLLGGGADAAAGADVAGSTAAVIAGTLVATGVAGLAFTWLRLRSGSLLAPALAHLGTNSVTFALAWWAAGP